MRLDFVVILVLKQVKSALIICYCAPILKLVTSAVILPKSYYPLPSSMRIHKIRELKIRRRRTCIALNSDLISRERDG